MSDFFPAPTDNAANPSDDLERQRRIGLAAAKYAKARAEANLGYTAANAAVEFGLESEPARGNGISRDVQAIRCAARAVIIESNVDPADVQNDAPDLDVGRNRRGKGRPRKDPTAVETPAPYGRHDVPKADRVADRVVRANSQGGPGKRRLGPERGYSESQNSRTGCCALSAPQLFLRSQRFERALDQSERRIRQMPRAERRTHRAGARGQPPARATSSARVEGTRVCPGRGAGEAARRGVYVTFFAYGYSCATRAVFLTKQTRARRRALMTRRARAGRSARGARPITTVATFAARTRVDLARRARRSRRDRGRDFFASPERLVTSDPACSSFRSVERTPRKGAHGRRIHRSSSREARTARVVHCV